MRNLKRALSLALASVMVIGMMVVGTGASYEDVKATDNVEAIEVLQAVGIMTGDENGDFNPDANVTRNEIAVIMSNLLNLDYDYYRGVNPFTDVPDWAAPYVAACAAEGVVAGIGGTLYGGSNNVTAAQAALMIMKALGYFQYQADFDNDWQIATIRQASYINLFDGINANAETALTRNQIAQLVLNGLKANMVTFTGTVGAEINGVTIGYKAEYTPKTNANSKYNRIDVGTTNIASDDKYFVQLGEELYNGDLRLTASTDVFGRPARYWEYDGKEIGTYVNNDLLLQEYTAKVTGDMLYELLTRNTVNTYSLTVVVNGVYAEDAPATYANQWFTKNQINRNNDATLGKTGNGVLTQVFVDNDKDEITVTIIDTYLAIANKDYDSKKDEISFDVWGVDKLSNDYYKNNDTNASTLKVTGEDFDIADLAEDDAVLVTIADGEIQTISDCELIAGTVIDAFETGSNKDNPSAPKAVEIDGTEYKFASAAEFDTEVMEFYTSSVSGAVNLKDKTYNVYMDAYGYVVGIEEVEKADNFLFITGIDLNGSNLGARTAKANAIFMDGTMKEIDINMTKSNLPTASFNEGTDGDPILNTWCTYTVNSKDVYSVSEVASAIATGVKYAQWQTVVNGVGKIQEINDRHISLDGAARGSSYYRVYGTDETVYLTVSLDELDGGNRDYGIIDDVESVVTGIGNANLEVWSKEDAESDADKATTPDTIHPVTGYVANGAYSLYNDKGDIIASVVVGEDAGSSKNLVYVNSAACFRESYNSTTDTWTWSRKVVSNGQEITLTEVGDGLNTNSGLGSMDQHAWYQVKYNAEGNVIEVIPAATALSGRWEYVENYNQIANAVGNNEDTVLYYGVAPQIRTADLKLTGKTLWLDSAATRGFRVAEEVNVALIQYNNNVEKTYYETGVTALKNVVNELNERHSNVNHKYIVSAVLEKGVATSIVIYDYNKNCDPYTDGDWDDNTAGDLTLTALTFNSTGMTVKVTNNTGARLLAGATVDVVVKNANGKLICSESTTLASNLAKDASRTLTFAGYKGVPTSAEDYDVTMTISWTASGVDYSYTGTATLGTV